MEHILDYTEQVVERVWRREVSRNSRRQQNGWTNTVRVSSHHLAAAKALADTKLSAEKIAEKSMEIAAEICVYTNGNMIMESLDTED